MNIKSLHDYPEKNQKIADYAKALSHPARIIILNFLEKQSCCFAGDLASQLPLAPSTVSQHINVLKDAGLIQGTFTPPNIKYCINSKNWHEAKILFKELFDM